MTEARLVWAALLLLAYTALCLTVVMAQRRRREQLARDTAALLPAADGTAAVLIAYASQTGFAEQLAWQTARALHTAGLAAELKPLGELSAADLQRAERALFIVSTYGEGDAPDGAARFARDILAAEPSLAQLRYGVLALGDRSYANFCGFGRRLDAWLQDRGADPLFARVDVDSADPEALQLWQQRLGRLAGTADLQPWDEPSFLAWRLVERRELNPGSLGAPIHHLELEPPASADGLDWEAGDLVQILAPADRARPREYSVASLPADGRLHLLVRQERHADGSLGAASGWLTRDALPSDPIELRLRAHRNFRIGENANRPLVLIGNGTGFAGLRAHLRARAALAAPARPCWLLFGERQAAHDSLYPEEIARWLERGVLERVDRVFSRDQAERLHVQHRLRAEDERLREWVGAGAAIYVCGSLQGMAGGVDTVLREVLGEETVDRLAAEGRYRRDVY